MDQCHALITEGNFSLKKLEGVPPADENGDIGTSDKVGRDESEDTNKSVQFGLVCLPDTILGPKK